MKSMPNILTVLRLLACPLLIYLFAIADYLWILIIFILACLTDFFDGYLARKKNFKSNFGKALDPIADKILIITMSVLIIVNEGDLIGSLAIPFYIIIIREIIVSSLRFNLVDKNKSIDVSLLSKYKTFIQMIAIGSLISFMIYHDPYVFVGYKANYLTIFLISFVKFFVWLSAFITVITGVQHYKTYLKLKKWHNYQTTVSNIIKKEFH